MRVDRDLDLVATVDLGLDVDYIFTFACKESLHRPTGDTLDWCSGVAPAFKNTNLLHTRPVDLASLKRQK